MHIYCPSVSDKLHKHHLHIKFHTMRTQRRRILTTDQTQLNNHTWCLCVWGNCIYKILYTRAKWKHEWSLSVVYYVFRLALFVALDCVRVCDCVWTNVRSATASQPKQHLPIVRLDSDVGLFIKTGWRVVRCAVLSSSYTAQTCNAKPQFCVAYLWVSVVNTCHEPQHNCYVMFMYLYWFRH